MDLNRTSLIQKIIAKGIVLTPFEAIQLKYLSRKGTLNDLIRAEKSRDLYKSIEEANGPISPFMIQFMVQKAEEESPVEFRHYNYAYKSMFGQDETSAKRGYLGLMFITQLRLIKAEFQNYLPKTANKSLLDFDSYSYYHEDIKTFKQTLEALAETFQYFIQDIDNILTLNYYLSQLVEHGDFMSLELLRMWLSKPKYSYEENFKYLNGAYLCCNQKNIQLILNKNHQSYVWSLERHVGKLPIDFAQESLRYVQTTICETIATGSK